ncbi:unnamed protein product [Caenorhabditis auriculariae]|uniref:Fungal lipase-type domain-containing protein n=1 Tax=Caenorhabditis auriculariae TaxID=2777116 RepID=A0A8S1HF56_9PELO|nr:unnamed protein product [Caenorhabditis auriculariae]
MRGLLLALLPLAALAMPFDVLSSTTHSIPYSDPLARNKLLYAAGAAYGTNPQQCLVKGFGANAKLQRVINVHCDDTPKDMCSGFSGVSVDDKAIILSFRGTNNNIQLIMEGLETVFTFHSPWPAGGVVSQYFNTGFMNIWNGGMKDDFNTLVSKYPGYTLYITGHSLGGAMATLAASFITYNKLYDSSKVIMVTYGQPRVGDAKFVAAHDQSVPNSYRVTHSRDPVPHLPLKNMEGFTHHKAEVFYKEKMTTSYRICDDVDESSLCSDGNLLPDSSIADHLHYFSIDVSNLGYSNCA